MAAVTASEGLAQLAGQADPKENLGFEALPDDMLANILSWLNPDELHICETQLMNKRIHALIIQKQLWRSLCRKLCSNFDAVVSNVDTKGYRRLMMRKVETHEKLDRRKRALLHRKKCSARLDFRSLRPYNGLSLSHIARMSEASLKSLMYTQICRRLGARSASESLIADAISASSVGHDHGQLTGVLSPHDSRMKFTWDQVNWFWLSAPSYEANVNHTLRFKLAHSLCLVHKVQIQPLLVDLAGEPRSGCGRIYAPQSVSFCFGSCQCGPFPVQLRDCVQTFDIAPLLCMGGEMLVKLCGGEKTAQQQFQAGIRYVKVVGTPLYNFTCQVVADLPVEAQMCKLSLQAQLGHPHHDLG